MKLEDELKQTKPFENEMQKLVLNIAVTNTWLNGILSDRLKPFDVSPHQYNVLRILRGKHPESYCNLDIAQRMVDKSSNATRIIDKLVEKGLSKRTEDANDRRQVNISITKKGLALLDTIESTPFAKKLKLKQFNQEKVKLMNEWLEELRE